MSEATREILDTVSKVLLRCWIIGIVLQWITLGAVLLMGDVIHAWHGALYGLSIHESGMITAGYLAGLKGCVAVFFFIPWLSIWLVLKKTKSSS